MISAGRAVTLKDIRRKLKYSRVSPANEISVSKMDQPIAMDFPALSCPLLPRLNRNPTAQIALSTMLIQQIIIISKIFPANVSDKKGVLFKCFASGAGGQTKGTK